MRFKIGDNVEVMNNKDVPVSWRTAEILSASGHTYTVQYDYYPDMVKDPDLEIVPRKFVRPRPPPAQGVESFMTGDIVEVFYQHSWKIAAILNILQARKGINKKKTNLTVAAFQDQYLARLLGCSQELVVDRSNIRVRQSWHDGKWILMGKSFRDVIAIEPSNSNCRKMKFLVPQFNARAKIQPKKDCANVPVDAASRESPVISSRSTKRMSPYDSSIIEEHNGNARKMRATERQGRKLRVVADPVLEKVDAVAYPKETLGEKYMHSSNKILSNGYYQFEREKQNVVLGYSGVRISEKSTSDSDACSVGSCSINNPSPNTWYSHFIPVHCEETDTLCSDAESSYGSGSNRRSSLPPKEEPEGNSWRHASFASNGLKMMPGFAAFLLALNFGRFSRLLPKICYGLWPLPGITQFNLQYFSVFQDLLDMIACLLLEGIICKHERTWSCEICVSINTKNMFIGCFVNVFGIKSKLRTHYRSSCITSIYFHRGLVDSYDSLNCEFYVSSFTHPILFPNY
ncbi:hypothetical protein ACS0TY_022327 [Phlomoides rotata]